MASFLVENKSKKLSFFWRNFSIAQCKNALTTLVMSLGGDALLISSHMIGTYVFEKMYKWIISQQIVYEQKDQKLDSLGKKMFI